MDSQIHAVNPVDELIDLIDSDWLTEQLEDDEVDIMSQLEAQEQRHALEQLNIEEALSVQFSQQHITIFDDEEDEEPHDNNHNEEDSMLGLMNQTYGDENSHKSHDKKKSMVGLQSKPWNELNLEEFHLAYEDFATHNIDG
jgi:hypothetical protein